MGGGGGGYFRSLLIANRLDFLRYRCVLQQITTKVDVLRWMMHIVTGGGFWGGIFSFVVDCKQTGCSSVQMCVVTN